MIGDLRMRLLATRLKRDSAAVAVPRSRPKQGGKSYIAAYSRKYYCCPAAAKRAATASSVLLEAMKLVQVQFRAAKTVMVLPSRLKELADRLGAPQAGVDIRSANCLGAGGGGYRHRLYRHGDDGVRVLRLPTVTLYKLPGLPTDCRRIITVKSLTMPNLLAGETVYPEFVQKDARRKTLHAPAGAVADEAQTVEDQGQAWNIIASLGEPGAADARRRRF